MSKLEEILAEHPTLTDFGFEGGFRTEQFRQNRQKLERSSEKVSWAAQWLLENLPKTQRVGKRRLTSYSIKHRAEKSHPDGYVSNGVLIAGALVAGYRFVQDGPNASLGVSIRAWEKLTRSAHNG